MKVIANHTLGQQPTDYLLEDSLDEWGKPVVKKWKIAGPNEFHKNGWDIKHGSCTRIVFPIDLDHYYLN